MTPLTELNTYMVGKNCLNIQAGNNDVKSPKSRLSNSLPASHFLSIFCSTPLVRIALSFNPLFFMSLSVDNLRFHYPDVPVLRDISFDVTTGDFLSLLGPNGSGKSTLLRLLDRILIPEAGSIMLKGRRLEDYSRRDLARLVAYVPQDTTWAFPYTVFEVVLMGRSPYVGRSGFENSDDIDRARAMMELTDIGHLAGKLITAISGGERQRALIARALCQQPEILLLDEPNAHLDINHQVEIFQILKEQNERKNLTIISVSHDLNLAASFSKRVLLLSESGGDGATIFAFGTPHEVLTGPNIETVYRTPVLVDQLPGSSTVRISLMPQHSRAGSPRVNAS